jgi:hypothetical protein
MIPFVPKGWLQIIEGERQSCCLWCSSVRCLNKILVHAQSLDDIDPPDRRDGTPSRIQSTMAFAIVDVSLPGTQSFLRHIWRHLWEPASQVITSGPFCLGMTSADGCRGVRTWQNIIITYIGCLVVAKAEWQHNRMLAVTGNNNWSMDQVSDLTGSHSLPKKCRVHNQASRELRIANDRNPKLHSFRVPERATIYHQDRFIFEMYFYPLQRLTKS